MARACQLRPAQPFLAQRPSSALRPVSYSGYRPKCVYGPGVSAASGPAFSGPKAFFGAEAGVVFRWAEGFFFHFGRGGGAGVFELLLGGLPGVVGELSQSVQVPFDGGAGVVFVHSAVAA